MSYNILNKNVKFQGATQGTIEDVVDTHSTQTIGGAKTITHLTGTHVRVTNDAVVLGNISASVNISASAFYGDGSNLTNTGVTINGATQNRITTVASNTSQLDGEANLTFDGSTLTIAGAVSGSGTISGSAFYGDGSNLSGIVTTLASNGGLANSSGILVSPTTAVTKSTSMHSADVLLIADSNNANVLRKVQAQQVADLFNAAVTTYGGDTANRVIVANGAGNIQGQTNLTFNGSVLTIAGDVSGSQVVSGNIGHFVTRVEAGAISLTTAAGLAGAGLVNNSGLLDVQVSGAVKIASDKIGISGSIAGNGLSFAGGADSLSSLAVNLDSNSGMAVGGSGLKTSFATLSSATPDVAADSIPFIDSAGDAKCTINTFLTQIAGTNVSVSGNQLTVAAPSTDIDALSALGGTGLHQTEDHFMFSDDGTEKKITFSNLEDAIFSNISSDATVAAGGAMTIANDAVDNNKLANIARGSVKVGGTGNAPTDLDAKTSGQILIGDGTDIASVAISGDVSLASNGAVTIAAGAVESGMLNDDIISGQGALGGATVAQADLLMIDDGPGTVKKVTFSNFEDSIFGNISGDATVAAGGALTIAANAVQDSMVNDDVATGLAGDGLGASSGVMSVNVDDSSIETASDTLRVKASGITDSMLSDGVATGLAGDGLVASSGVMAVQVQGALKISSDAIGITGSIAGNGLQAAGTADAVSSLAVSVDNSTIEINSDSLRLKDNGVTLAKMAGLARGKIIVGDSSGDPTSLTLGSAGQLLVSDGDDLLYRSLGGDASLGADGTLTIAANAVEGSMLNSNVAGSGLDYGSNQLSVDVSDFMANGVDNRVLTATGADAMTGEANLTFDGSLLTVAGTGSATKLRANYTGGGHTDAVFLISGSNTENLFQIMQQGNGYPTAFLAGENHSTYPGLLYNRGKLANGGAISQGNVEGAAGSHTRLTVRKTSIADNTATDVVTITVPNANHAAAIRVFGLANFDNCNYAQSFSFEGSLARGSGSPTDKAFSSVTTTENAGITPNFAISVAGSANTGGNSATQTFTLQLTINTSDSSSSNATIMIELINFNDSGITMAAS